MPDDRGGTFTMRISDAEKAMLVKLAEERGLSASDILRQYIRREHSTVFGETKPAKKRAAAKGKRE